MTSSGFPPRPHPSRPRTALISGTFDVGNFGDLLFPIVAAHRLRPFGWNVLAASPTNGSCGLQDAAPSIALASAVGRATIDAVLIGGGEIVHAFPADFVAEYGRAGQANQAYPALWFGATFVASLLDVPIAWNAPGAPAPFSASIRESALDPALAAADYVSVRDEASRRFLQPDGGSAVLVPDTVADLAHVWPAASLAADFDALCQRKGIVPEDALFAVQARPGGLGNVSPTALAAMIADFAQSRGLTPLLLSLGPSLGDVEVLRQLSQAMPIRHILLDDPAGLREMAAAIANARLYVGNSMHGYVAAACYATPGVIVARPAFHKFVGFACQIDATDDVARNWPDALERAAQRINTRPNHGSSVAPSLDRHWESVAKAIDDPEHGRARRAAFLRLAVTTSFGRDGFDGLLAPLLNDRYDRRSRTPTPSKAAAGTGL
ncbi:polysaccharide pyruvyl transferase family protein [Mesorhizobium sp. LHD-90]|uniref:polysaccharide pyruvyl transferase family protein n=1 Tax=Mesorhizobium sp. LHD-90 TaxID=3071414 RepID=UPI0027DF4082|nr:polysaccharide pyruvyl transferase family protein [Mesorhizobium sp. LHD-90]MDQ6437380.1 polysaccharide pyruvyl transferase family protein [Mesorhizobium sp. LHD-90]